MLVSVQYLCTVEMYDCVSYLVTHIIISPSSYMDSVGERDIPVPNTETQLKCMECC